MLMDLGTEGSLIGGIRVCQHKDFGCTWDMNEYATKLELVDVPRGYISQNKEIDDQVMSQVVSCNGKLGWLGSNGRPDLAAGHSIIAGQYKHKSCDLITMCN